MANTLIPWPTVPMLERMGLVRCKTDGCTTFVDPVNVPARRCRAHWLEHRRAQKVMRSSEVRFAPTSHRSDRVAA